MEEVMRNFLKQNWVLIAAIIYVISPIDFIPDTLLPVGFADDIAVLLATLFIRYLKHRRDTKLQTNLHKNENVVEGEIVE